MKPLTTSISSVATLCTALLLGSCARQEDGTTQATETAPWRPVVSEQLEAFAAEGLPEVTQDTIDDFIEAMELAESSGQTAVRFRARLEQAEPLVLTSALLEIVESRDYDLVDKGRAYAWLRAKGSECMVPRLTLRLKYEKDWVANVDIALALLKFGSGAGLQAFRNILGTEEFANDANLEYARFRTMQGLSFLPANNTWKAGDGFASDWQRLLDVQDFWFKHRELPDHEKTPPSRDQRAELWRMMARLRSQPLRPVDDARFVMSRMPNWVFEPLTETILDEDRYVREHALQTLAWIGYPVGRWARQDGIDLTARYLIPLATPRLRPRVLEAMGASGLSSMGTPLLAWLQTGNMEEITAAADALLRCADEEALPEVAAVLTSDSLLSPESRYSLKLLLSDDQGLEDVELPVGLDSSGGKRRLAWRMERVDRPL